MAEIKEVKKDSTAKLYLDNVVSTALVLDRWIGEQSDFGDLAAGLALLVDEVAIEGSFQKIENSLAVQSKTLQFIFNRMVSIAADCKTLEKIKTFMDIGLRAQNQARKTILALHSIKHPPQKQFVEQQNIAFNQQVNNGATQERLEIESKNELLEKRDEQRLDSRASVTPSTINQALAAMEISRGENAAGNC